MQEPQPRAGRPRPYLRQWSALGAGGTLRKDGGGEAEPGASRAAPAWSVVAPSPRRCGLGDRSLRHGATRSGRKSHRPLRSGVWMEEGPLQFPSPPSKEGSAPPSPTAPPPKLRIHCPQGCDPPPSWPAPGAALVEGWTQGSYWRQESSRRPWMRGHGACSPQERSALPGLPKTEFIFALCGASDIRAVTPPPPPHFPLDPELFCQPTLPCILGVPSP